nr:hypothetical protein [Pandoravirus massiliensis]
MSRMFLAHLAVIAMALLFGFAIGTDALDASASPSPSMSASPSAAPIAPSASPSASPAVSPKTSVAPSSASSLDNFALEALSYLLF